MPDDTTPETITWDFRATSPQIAWVTSGYKNEKDTDGRVVVRRYGLMRVNVRGKKATVLKKRRRELAWSVVYSSSSNPSLGVESIEISPGVPHDVCSADNANGCAFDPTASFAEAGIAAKKVCHVKLDWIEITGFALSHANKRTTLAQLIAAPRNPYTDSVSASLKMLFASPRVDLCVSGCQALMRAAHADLKRSFALFHTVTAACVRDRLTKTDGAESTACRNRSLLFSDIEEQIAVQLPTFTEYYERLVRRCSGDRLRCIRENSYASFVKATDDMELISQYAAFLDDIAAHNAALEGKSYP
jgi:hypothetical protein